MDKHVWRSMPTKHLSGCTTKCMRKIMRGRDEHVWESMPTKHLSGWRNEGARVWSRKFKLDFVQLHVHAMTNMRAASRIPHLGLDQLLPPMVQVVAALLQALCAGQHPLSLPC
eukprot:642209-Pelagomonas_calceolata.AAC.4